MTILAYCSFPSSRNLLCLPVNSFRIGLSIPMISNCSGLYLSRNVIAPNFWNILRPAHLNRIVIIVLRVFRWGVLPVQDQVLMTLVMLQIRKPAHTFHSYEFFSIFINPRSNRRQGIVIKSPEFSVPTGNTGAVSYPILLEERENLFIGNRIHVTNN